MTLWPHQDRARRFVLTRWARGVRRICLVMPTGSGKTETANAILREGTSRGRRALWLTHTRDLVRQTAKRLGGAVIMAGEPRDATNPLQVASLQTACSRDFFEPFDIVIFDECQFSVTDQWGELFRKWTNAYQLGLTATPERSDGKPLKGQYDELVVGAQYSELLRAGYIVPCRVFRPEAEIERGLAKSVVDSVVAHAGDGSGFVYCNSVEEARREAQLLTIAGYPSAVISANTDDDERDELLSKLERGELRFITNVYTMTIGVDVPSASVCVMARRVGHPSIMIQECGRVLRSHPGKKEAIIIDLPGNTHAHGVPIQDREYSLDGKAIRLSSTVAPLRVCVRCGFVWENAVLCPSCGWRPPLDKGRNAPPRIFNRELREVYCGGDTPQEAKLAEWHRLLDVCDEKGFSHYFATKKYKELFHEEPPREEHGDATRQRKQYDKWAAEGASKGYKPGWAAFRFKATYGALPPRAWTEQAQVLEGSEG